MGHLMLFFILVFHPFRCHFIRPISKETESPYKDYKGPSENIFYFFSVKWHISEQLRCIVNTSLIFRKMS